MMGHHITIVLIVTVVMIATVLQARFKAHAAQQKGMPDPETVRIREEMKMLRDRLAVLERIATEKEHSLSQEIERLRDQ